MITVAEIQMFGGEVIAVSASCPENEPCDTGKHFCRGSAMPPPDTWKPASPPPALGGAKQIWPAASGDPPKSKTFVPDTGTYCARHTAGKTRTGKSR